MLNSPQGTGERTMPCGKPAVVTVVAKPSGTHLAACEDHKEDVALDLGQNSSSIVEVPIADGDEVSCAYMTDHEIDEVL
jgi:hypothetical protein